jgi:ADP-ribose pyrophosphatase YjhB (NUDIX family)
VDVTGVREWFVAGGIVETDDGVLLVRNVRRNGSSDWTPPGGVIEVHEGETVLDGLTREVSEETGLTVISWEGPAYEVVATAPDLGWIMRVEVYRAVGHEGELMFDDPDGIVVEAAFVAPDRCHEPLATTHPWVREPLSDWLVERWDDTRRYEYRVEGAPPEELVITRVS